MNLLTGLTDGESVAKGSVQTVVSLSYPVQDGANPFGLPDRVLPVVLDLPEDVKFYPKIADIDDLVKGLHDALVGLRTDNRLPADFLTRATLQFEVSVFSNVSETGIPLIHLQGLYLACANLSWN